MQMHKATGHTTRLLTSRPRLLRDQLRCLVWEDLSTSLKEARQDDPVIEELEQFRVA
jgi:hypothetical protein